MHFQDVELTLTCWPPVPDHVARPWDAADELLLQNIEATSTLILNDRYGALQTALPYAHVWADSAAAVESARRNLSANQHTQTGITVFSENNIPTDINLVLIKVPKQFELLQFWLSELQKRLPTSTQYHLAGMVKHWPTSWLKWLENHAHSYNQSPISRKARMVELTLNKPLPQPKLWTGYDYQGLRFEGLPGVFAREQLDIGSSVLLNQSGLDISGTVCDLGCGNGLLGLSLMQQHPIERLILTDDSFVAVRSAKYNADAANLSADVHHGDCLEAVPETLDWVLCNPPFHDGHKQLTNIAATMFKESADKLHTDGNLLVIANRHLPYTPLLKRYFKRVNSMGQDTRFSVYHCQMPIHKQNR